MQRSRARQATSGSPRSRARGQENTEKEDAAAAAPVINWYPGHIARRARTRGYLKRVDVVVEARDARIGRSTAHPDLAEWVGDRPRVVVFDAFADLRPSQGPERLAGCNDEDVFFVDARRGGDKEFRGVRGALQERGRPSTRKEEEGHRRG